MEQNEKQNFGGLRVIAFESRRTVEMTTLIENQAGVATVVPSMRELPLTEQENGAARDFAGALLAGKVDMIIFLTGVGTRMLASELESHAPPERLVAALAQTVVVARGPKPVVALREWGVPVTVRVPEPNTWREVLATLDAERDVAPVAGKRVAIQEYGVVNPHLVQGLEARGATVTRIPIYRWALPQDVEPLHRAVESIIAGQQDVALFTTGTQIWHLFQIAALRQQEAALRQGLGRMVVASIGPTCSEALDECGVLVDLQPEHPRMGQLVKHAAVHSRQWLADKPQSLHGFS